MTKKRRLVLVGASLAICVAVVAGATMMLPTRPSLSKATFEKVEKAMPREVVERMLGQPLGQVDRIYDGMTEVVWELADRTRAHVVFTNGVVAHMSFERDHLGEGAAMDAGAVVRNKSAIS